MRSHHPTNLTYARIISFNNNLFFNSLLCLNFLLFLAQLLVSAHIYFIFNFCCGIRYQIDYLEIEIHRLRDENAKLKEMLQSSDGTDSAYYVWVYLRARFDRKCLFV